MMAGPLISRVDGHGCDQVVAAFLEILGEYEADDIIPRYGSTPAEMARLLQTGASGWLCTSHIIWVLDRLNREQDRSVCLCLNASSVDEVRRMVQKKNVSNVNKLIFVCNVGKNNDNSVYVGTDQRGGNHWVLAVVDLAGNTVQYCDSLGWDYPHNFLQVLSQYTELFGVSELPTISMMHKPTPVGYNHTCTAECRNYPLQTCSNVCGLVAVLCAVVAALDAALFHSLTGPRTTHKIYLHRPSQYEMHLRRILITWFVAGKVDMHDIWPGPNSLTEETHNKNGGSTYSVTSRSDEPSQPQENARSQSQQNSVLSENVKTTLSQSGTSPQHLLQNPKVSFTSKRLKSKGNICSVCFKTFSVPSNLRRHEKTFHGIDNVGTQFYYCNSCPDFTHTTAGELISHCRSRHNNDIKIDRLSFKSEQQFISWKKKTEKANLTRYVKARGTRTRNNFKHTYYYCNRSGNPRIIANRKRAFKCQGTCKTGTMCTSFMKMHESLLTGKVDVEYCLHHNCQEKELCHLHISEELKCMIASKLTQGVNINVILDKIRENITQISRDALLTRKDIANVKRDHNISTTQKHADDSHSVELWVQELTRGSENPIIFYKPQGSTHDILQDSDFLLCFQTPFQKEMMKKYSSKIVCMDSTYCTTQYDFILTTVLVLDDFEEGVAVAWAISNREDSEVLEIFLKAVKDNCNQDIHVHTFMTDMANNFYNSWIKVFSVPQKRLYCAWHVDRSWRKKLSELIPCQQMQSETYGYLKILQTETNESNFCKMMQEFLSFLKVNATSFADYFSKTYVQDEKVKLWAACYRIGCNANTNMYAEAFHRVLKGVYFNKKQNRRVDMLLSVLVKVARDKMVEQMIKLEKGKISHRIRDIRSRHQGATSIKNIMVVGLREWTVPSQSKKSVTHTVKKISTDDACRCKLMCDACKVCIHMYTCTCKDFLTHPVACKHVHAVHMLEGSKEPLLQAACSQNKTDDHSFFDSVLCKNTPGPQNNEEIPNAQVLSWKRKFDDCFHLLTTCITENDSNLDAAFNKLEEAFAFCSQTLHPCAETTFKIKQTYPSRKEFDKQRKFFSTKRKSSKRLKLKLKKPSNVEKEKLQHNLSTNVPSHCGICFQENDKGTSPEILWVQCGACNVWVHVTCDPDDNEETSPEYNCSSCRRHQTTM